MELRGSEQRIRALFSELSLEDQRIAPRFEQLWTRTQPAKAVRSSSRLVVALASLLIIAAFASLAVWSNYEPVTSVSSVAETVETTKPEPRQEILVAGPKKSNPIKRRRKTERSITREAALLSSWQSPTEIFMTSPTTVVLNSLPQLDQSANQLKQFLPKNNDVMRESNQ